MSRRGKGTNHVWTAEEDAKLIECMLELKQGGRFNGENGNGLRKGYQEELERMLREKLPEHGLKEKPHIESRCKTMKKQYYMIYEVRNNGQLSGFGWDDQKKCVTASADVWDDYLRANPECTFMRNKSFVYYDELTIIWGQDRANGNNAEAPADMVEEIVREENVDQEDGEESDGDDDPNTLAANPGGDGTSKNPERKRRRSADSLILSLEHLTNALTTQMQKSDEQMLKVAENFAGGGNQNVDNRHKLNEELQKVDVLTAVEKQRAAMKLVHDPNLLDYFFTLSTDEKEIFLVELLV
ncbi:OLC1v1023783C1 [Oldenlandia corymbosa var. corymbosa]|uniref:OLC1v1023783C1 n=1 Tax=Oldenlandia corymbosa var. corymbosa TaxID=529605 RepID=A0AAV1C0Q7_OLDCO|nr:OLC1v1023783C1 [Oldenlandia corymbosa var. corymbosa]